jgi:hypothetical protein
MAPENDVAELVGLEPDPGLLAVARHALPAAVGHPDEIEPSPARKRVVGLGAALTGITLVLGVLLTTFGVIDGFATGFDAASIVALVIGIALISTHWGWVHVAELTGQRIERRANRDVMDRREAWLGEIEPYTRWEVETATEADGTIAIVTTRYQPVRKDEHQFTFTKQVTGRERHPADEPAAPVAERAELVRQQAALDTARERERYQVARDAYEDARLADADERERLAAARAASEALSERINSNLREPPLTE